MSVFLLHDQLFHRWGNIDFFFIALSHGQPQFVLFSSSLQISWSVFDMTGSMFGTENQEVSGQSEELPNCV